MLIMRIKQIASNKIKETAQSRTVETTTAAIIVTITQSHIKVGVTEAVATIEEEDAGVIVREMHHESHVFFAIKLATSQRCVPTGYSSCRRLTKETTLRHKRPINL